MASEADAPVKKLQATTKISALLDEEMRRHIEKRHGTLRELVLNALEYYVSHEESEGYIAFLAGYIVSSKTRRAKHGVTQLSYEASPEQYTLIRNAAISFDCYINSFVEGIICQYLADTTADFRIKP